MAILANIAGLTMCQGLPGGLDTIVASGTVAGEMCVVEYRRYPLRACVAVIALVTGKNVARWLARGTDTIVAGIAAP